MKGFLFDLDGVFYISDIIIDGAIETLNYLKNYGISFRFVTNTTEQRTDVELKNKGKVNSYFIN